MAAWPCLKACPSSLSPSPSVSTNFVPTMVVFWLPLFTRELLEASFGAKFALIWALKAEKSYSAEQEELCCNGFGG